MSKEYFTENISDETLAKLIDKTLRFEKSQESDRIKRHWLKIIPAVATIVLVIGVINILPMFQLVNDDGFIEPSEMIEAYTNNTAMFVPQKVEKEFFETNVLAAITNARARSQMAAYYSLQGDYYVLDEDISKREKDTLLEYYEEYTELTGDDVIRMYRDNEIEYDPANPVKLIVPVDPNDPYGHVRFGRTRDILLLDVEWHTYDAYLKEVVEPFKNGVNEDKTCEWYLLLPDDEKLKWDIWWEELIKKYEENLENINNKYFSARSINGKNVDEIGYLSFYGSKPNCDADGYFIFEIYPYYPELDYKDENGEWQWKRFFYNHGVCMNDPFVNSRYEYDEVLENKIIPFCDDLLERGLISQEYYDYITTLDPLAYYVDLYF